jgi:hypothetical protein
MGRRAIRSTYTLLVIGRPREGEEEDDEGAVNDVDALGQT